MTMPVEAFPQAAGSVVEPFAPRGLASGAHGQGVVVARGERWFCMLAVLVGVAAALYFYGLRGSLWEDEIIAVTHLDQPLPLFFMQVLRNDIHPPLYFLQLDLWSAIGGNTDRWMWANSLLWAAVGLLAVFHVARAAHGTRAAWYAVAVFAVLPSFAWSAGTLRMYALVPVVALCVYHVNRRWFETRSPRWLAAVFVAQVVMAYVHAIEFFFVAFIVLAALVEAGAAGRLRMPSVHFGRSVRLWMIVQALFVVCVLPLAASALVRGSDASAPDAPLASLFAPGTLIAGWKASSSVWLRLAGGVVFVVLVGAGVVERSSRWRTLVVPLLVLVVATLLGILVKPIFKQPVFAANLLPFIALGAGAAAARLPLARVATSIVIVVLAIAALPIARIQQPVEAYADAARKIRTGVARGDVVLVPNVSVYWGMMRYAVGADWGRPLSVFPAPNPQWAALNARLERTLGADAPRRLGLVPERDYVDSAGVRYVLGGDATRHAGEAGHVWVLTHDHYEANLKIDPVFVASETVGPETFGGELLVRRFDRKPAP